MIDKQYDAIRRHKKYLCRRFLTGMVLLMAFSGVLFTPAHAGTISMTTKMSVNVSGERVSVTIDVTNHGNEAARDVQVFLTIFGETLKSRVVKRMEVNAPAHFTFSKNEPGIRAGRYPLSVLLDYHDANRYPFSATSGMTFRVGDDVDQQLSGRTMNARIPLRSRPGSLKIEVRNLAEKTRRITARLSVPRELSADRDRIEFTLPAKGRETLIFRVRNFTAKSGATYPVHCFLEFDADGQHQTAIVQPTLEIAEQENWFKRTFWVWVFVAVILLGVIVYFQFRETATTSTGKKRD